MQPVRTAVIGVGMIGTSHAAVLDRSPLSELLACCDPDPDAAGRIPHGVPLLGAVEEALALPDLEAVVVCTPEPTHREIVEPALERGLAVFCEKPLAHTLADADAMVATAERCGGLLVVGHMLRFDPDYLAVQDAVERGRIGRVVSLHARRNIPSFEGALIATRKTLPVEVGVHDLDVLRWLGGDIERVYAEASSGLVLGQGLVDAVVGTLRFATGAIGTIEFNWIMAAPSGLPSDYRLAAFGTAGSAFAEYRHPSVGIYGAYGTTLPRTSWLTEVQGFHAGTLKTQDEHFLRTVREGGTWPVSLADARAALAVAIGLDRSMALGQPVSLHDIDS